MHKLYCFTESGATAGHCECCSGGGGDSTDFTFPILPPVTETPEEIEPEYSLPENYTEGACSLSIHVQLKI